VVALPAALAPPKTGACRDSPPGGLRFSRFEVAASERFIFGVVAMNNALVSGGIGVASGSVAAFIQWIFQSFGHTVPVEAMPILAEEAEARGVAPVASASIVLPTAINK